MIQRTVDKVPIRSHFLNPVSDLNDIVTFRSDIVEVWNIEPEMRVVSKVQVEGAQLRVRDWCVVGDDLEHVQQSQPIGGRHHIPILLPCQDTCPQNLFHGLIGSLAAPLAWAWKGEVILALTSMRWHRYFQITLVNFVSLSETILDGSSLWRTTSCRN